MKKHAIGASFCAGLLFALFPNLASAETIEFACQRIDVSNPDTLLWQVDTSTSRASLVSGDAQYRWSAEAVITPTSIDWQDGGQKWHLDRLSGI